MGVGDEDLAGRVAWASTVIVQAFVTENYSIKYVQRYSDALQPLFYKVTSYWGGLDGSIMFWVFLLSIFGSLADSPVVASVDLPGWAFVAAASKSSAPKVPSPSTTRTRT